MKITKLDHVALVSDDSAISRDWYCDVFGMEWVYRGKWNNNPYFLKKGDAFIAIFQRGEKNPGKSGGVRIDHFAFRAETNADYEEIKETLRSRDLGFDEEDHQISKSIYIKDPDQITVEITTYDV